MNTSWTNRVLVMPRYDGRKRHSFLTLRRSQEFRQSQTYPERLLWSVLRGKQVAGLRFRRQHPIEPYVVDFYCAAARLVIEIDGESHNGREQYDLDRSQFLIAQNLCTLRFANDEVLENLDGVLHSIAKAAGVKIGE